MILDHLAFHPISAFCASLLNKRPTPSGCGASSSSCPEYNINSPVANRSCPDWVHRFSQSPSTARLNHRISAAIWAVFPASYVVRTFQVLGMIRRNITHKVKSLIVPLYKAIVRPHLEYCIQAWSPYLRKDIDMLEKIQRRATKLIPELRDLRYEERLKECGLTTLETRRLRGDQIEVFKILNGYENIDSNIFFEIKKSKITRGHNFTLVKKQSRLDVRKYSFSQRTINVWNKLSTDCVHATSVNVFKNRIDKYLVKAGYT